MHAENTTSPPIDSPPNEDIRLAYDYIRDTGTAIFLTGKAGTGKTTFLKSLKKVISKRMVVTAPTGVAAINAGGVTLHSFFQLPFGPFIPGTFFSGSHHRVSREKINILKSIDLLVIDEISMVRADVLDSIDSVLRKYRHSQKVFGGVQLLMIGDLFQLPPVVKNDEWRLLCKHYPSPYFFNSKALANTETITIELKHVYRQQDQNFIEILNKIRTNSVSQQVLKKLNTRFVGDISSVDKKGYITLSTHNRKVDGINETQLTALAAQPAGFKAQIEGDFPEHAYPTSPLLTIKTGAQVMFVKNDPSPEKLYFNGKIGSITKISPKEIRVKCPDDINEIIVEPVAWDNFEYSFNQETQEISETKIGTYIQFPLKLAWAITIHKSQGLTFDKAIIDAQSAFSHGQVYVALSRCRTLEGIQLSSPLQEKSIIIDQAIQDYFQKRSSSNPSLKQFTFAKICYQQQLLFECFNFSSLRNLLGRLISLIMSHHETIHVSGMDDIRSLKKTTEKEICNVGANFSLQLQSLFNEHTLPTDDSYLSERLIKASKYFLDKMDSGICKQLDNLILETDNKELRKRIRKTLQLLQDELGVKHAVIRCCEKFSPADYFKAISSAQIKSNTSKRPLKHPLLSENDITHPEFFSILKEWRNIQAEKEGIAKYMVLHQKTLIQIAIHLPRTISELLSIKGIGKLLSKRYGQEIIDLVANYCQENSLPEKSPALSQPVPQKDTATPPSIPTRDITFDLHRQGLTPAKIAKERGLAVSTIEGHLARLIQDGRIDISSLLPNEKIVKIEATITDNIDKNLSELKRDLGDDIAYAEIRYVKAHLSGNDP